MDRKFIILCQKIIKKTEIATILFYINKTIIINFFVKYIFRNNPSQKVKKVDLQINLFTNISLAFDYSLGVDEDEDSEAAEMNMLANQNSGIYVVNHAARKAVKENRTIRIKDHKLKKVEHKGRYIKCARCGKKT